MRVGFEYKRPGQPIGVFADVAVDGLSGDNGAASNTTFRGGLSIEFGTLRPGGPETRPFASPDPLRNLIRRGLF